MKNLKPKYPNVKVLVIDDNRELLDFLTGVLRGFGYDVEEASTGYEGLEKAFTYFPEVVILDVRLPDISGFNICHSLRQSESCALTPIIFLSGFPDHETHLQALESGGDDFLGKPFSSAELVIRIDNVLKVKYLQRDLLEEVQKSEDLAIQKDQLYEFIVHDIKNLLTGILANIELAGRSNDLAVVMRYIDRMNKSANGMRRMMQDLLDISRAEQVGIELQKTIINAPIFFKEICMLAEGLVKVKNQNFFSTCEVEEFYGDADLLKRALLNLVENSIKYSKEGSAIFLSARDIGNTALIEISVADNGVGIPEEYRDRIFEKYMRLESSASKARVSSGLGLSLCKVAIEAHGGKIWVEANHPTGSIFRIQLPKDGASRGTSV